MKKIILLTILGLTFTSVKSQDISDAMRYAVPNLNGTARYSAMSGAFGAVQYLYLKIKTQKVIGKNFL